MKNQYWYPNDTGVGFTNQQYEQTKIRWLIEVW